MYDNHMVLSYYRTHHGEVVSNPRNQNVKAKTLSQKVREHSKQYFVINIFALTFLFLGFKTLILNYTLKII